MPTTLKPEDLKLAQSAGFSAVHARMFANPITRLIRLIESSVFANKRTLERQLLDAERRESSTDQAVAERDNVLVELESIRQRQAMLASVERADVDKLIAWISNPARKSASLSFANNPERRVAFAIEQIFIKEEMRRFG